MDQDRPRRLSGVRFRWHARFGFFLRAEAAVAGFSYPLPPRTAALGLIGSILGLQKDALATELAEARVAVHGALPATHWHRGNFRKDPPAPVPYRVTAKAKGSSGAEKNTQLRQEWLLAPSYELIVALPGEHHRELVRRLHEGTTRFSPCMGLSEMLAAVELRAELELAPLEQGRHEVSSVVPETDSELDTRAALSQGLHVISLSMTREVSAERRFGHAVYFAERHGRPLPCRSSVCWRSSDGATIAFL
jgi:CRISPR-associated protein Cas5h